jgi:spore maturation protein CgeB
LGGGWVRVGVVGPSGPDEFAPNICDALNRMSHKAVWLGAASPCGGRFSRVASLARQAFPRFDELAQLDIARKAFDAACDVVINIDVSLMPVVVTRLRRGGVRTAFWFPDSVMNIGRQLMLLSSYDALFFKEPHLVDRLRAMLDLNVYYLPEACNPRWHRPAGPAAVEPTLVVAGNMYPSRVRLLERLIAKGIPVTLYGPGFPRWTGDTPARDHHTGRCVFGEEKARVFRSAAGVLNALHPAEITGVNARLFEAAGSGAAVLAEFRPSLPDLFSVDDEVLTFRDFDELVDQATRLLNEEGLATRLGDAAARRAHRDHTYEQRIEAILEKLS